MTDRASGNRVQTSVVVVALAFAELPFFIQGVRWIDQSLPRPLQPLGLIITVALAAFIPVLAGGTFLSRRRMEHSSTADFSDVPSQTPASLIQKASARPIAAPSTTTKPSITWVLRAFEKLGFAVLTTSSENPEFIESVALKDQQKILIRYYAGQRIGPKEVDGFSRALQQEQATGGYLITTGHIVASAKDLALSQPLFLVDGQKLSALMQATLPLEELVSNGSSTQRPAADRRRSPRLLVADNAPCEVVVENLYKNSYDIQGRLQDLSEGGCRFFIPDAVSMPSLTQLQLKLEGVDGPISLTGELIWQRDGGENPGHICGVRFFLIKERDRQTISRYIQSRLANQPAYWVGIPSNPN